MSNFCNSTAVEILSFIGYANNIQLLDEAEQNIVIYQWRADQATDKSRYFAIGEFNNCFIIYRLVYAQIQEQLTKKGEFFNFF